jgi:uncharacterized protein YbjT (DUF2867 family)
MSRRILLLGATSLNGRLVLEYALSQGVELVRSTPAISGR